MTSYLTPIVEWLHRYETVAIWLEGVSLVLILVFEEVGRRDQHKESLEQLEISRRQMEIWRKQIHADRVAEIFRALRDFERFIVRGVNFDKTIGPRKDFSSSGDYSNKGGSIFKEYLNLQEAYYLSYLVSDPLAAYMKERMAEADGLQRVPTEEEFHQKAPTFSKKLGRLCARRKDQGAIVAASIWHLIRGRSRLPRGSHPAATGTRFRPTVHTHPAIR